MAGTIPGVEPRERPPVRYLHTSTDPVIGACHFWSAVPGGLDAWDPLNEPEVVAIVTSSPQCPAPDVPEDIAWRVFRSWTLDPPMPELQPADAGITGLASYLAAAPPAAIVHSEVLPDGRMLEVRATVASIEVDWGDGSVTRHDPAEAAPYPLGSVTHTFATKTCPEEYRRSHPRGHLCHETLAAYPITATYRWVGEWSVGAAWSLLEEVDRATTLDYDVDEIIGLLRP